MADIIIKGQAHEGMVRMAYDGHSYEFACSKGAWCNIPKVHPGTDLDEVVDGAIWHVDKHDADVNEGRPDGAEIADVSGLCSNCLKAPGDLVVDPYIQELEGVTVTARLCPACFQERSDDI